MSQSDDEVAGDSDAGASSSDSASEGSGSDADEAGDALFKVKKDGNKTAASMDTSRFAMYGRDDCILGPFSSRYA